MPASFSFRINCSTWGFVVKYQKRSPVGNILARVSTRNRTGSWMPSKTRSIAIVMNTRVSTHKQHCLSITHPSLFNGHGLGKLLHLHLFWNRTSGITGTNFWTKYHSCHTTNSIKALKNSIHFYQQRKLLTRPHPFYSTNIQHILLKVFWKSNMFCIIGNKLKLQPFKSVS